MITESLIVPGTRHWWIVRERQGLKFTEPRASLWKILSIFRHAKQYTWNICFSSIPDQNGSFLPSGRYMTVYISVNTEFIILPLFDGDRAKENSEFCIYGYNPVAMLKELVHLCACYVF